MLGEFYLLCQDGKLEVKLKKDNSVILCSTLGAHVYTLESRGNCTGQQPNAWRCLETILREHQINISSAKSGKGGGYDFLIKQIFGTGCHCHDEIQDGESEVDDRISSNRDF